MAAKAEKRIQKRLIMEDAFTVLHRGSPCRVVDISESGLGVAFISEEEWPKTMTLEYYIDPARGKKKSLQCVTVWESTMDFYKARSEETVRRRGLIFMDPASGEVKELNRYLREIAET